MKKTIKGPLECITEDFASESKEYDEYHYGDCAPSPEETEVQNKFFRINKEEELYSIDYIKKMVMKYVVELFTMEYKHLATFNKHMFDNAVEKMNRSFKKMFHHNFIGKRKRDVIWYETSPIIGNYKFVFTINKDEDGSLVVAYINPLSRVPKHFLVNTHGKLIPLYEAIIPSDGGIPKYTPKEKYELFYKISKQEEQQALDYIKKMIVPIVVEKFHKSINYSEEGIVTNDKVRRGLQKIISKTFEFYMGNKVDVIVWNFKKNYLNFTFMIRKWGAGSLVVRAFDPITRGSKYYNVGSIPPVQLSLTISSIPELEFLLKENTEGEENFRLTKEEEQRGLQYIRNEVLPVVLEEYNKAATELNLPQVHYGPEEDSIIHSLRKIRHETFPIDLLDRSIYIAEFKKYKWIFMVEKIRGHVRAGFIDPFFSESRLYDINFSISDPKRPPAISSGRRIKGYMPHGGGLINEVHSQGPYPEITREEEQQAFQYIRRHIIPLFVKEYNSNSRDNTKNITDSDINRNLKKDSVYRWPDGNISTIYYVAMMPSDTFIFMIRKDLNSGRLKAGYNDPFSHGQHSFYVGGKILQEFKKLRELLKVERKPLL